MAECIRKDIIIENAFEELQKRCISAAVKQYGDPLPIVIEERLELELKAINHHGYASSYYICALLAEHALDNGYTVSSRGLIGSALVSFLCGISNVSPQSVLSKLS